MLRSNCVLPQSDDPRQPLDGERLVKSCGMLGSEYVGERAAAAAQADRLIRAAGLGWPDIILPALPPAPVETPAPTRPFSNPIEFVFANAECLSEWENGFIKSLA